MTSFMFANVTTAKTSADYIRLTRLAQSTLAGNLKVRIYSSQHLICSCSLPPQVYFCTSVIQHTCASVIRYFCTSVFQHFYVSVILYFCISSLLCFCYSVLLYISTFVFFYSVFLYFSYSALWCFCTLYFCTSVFL